MYCTCMYALNVMHEIIVLTIVPMPDNDIHHNMEVEQTIIRIYVLYMYMCTQCWQSVAGLIKTQEMNQRIPQTLTSTKTHNHEIISNTVYMYNTTYHMISEYNYSHGIMLLYQLGLYQPHNYCKDMYSTC